MGNIDKIENEFTTISDLPDRPNEGRRYGEPGLTAAQLKAKFEENENILRLKINEMVDIILGEGENGIASVIKTEIEGYATLGELISAFQSGDLARDVLKLYPDASNDELWSLQGIINIISEALTKRLEIYDNPENITKVYAHSPANDSGGPNKPKMLDASPSTLKADVIPLRTTNGNIIVPTDKTELTDNGAVPKSYVDKSKVEKSNTAKIIYGTDSAGEQTEYKVGENSSNGNENSVVQRDGLHVLVPLTPNSNYHAASKGYVDDKTKAATIEKAGVVKVGEESDGKGVGIINEVLHTIPATEQQIKAKTSDRLVITPKNLDHAVKEGLANNALTWTEEEKARAREKLGTMSSDEIEGMVNGTLKFRFVSELPTVGSDIDKKAFYFVPIDGEEGDLFEEWVYALKPGGTYEWESLGTPHVDLSDYIKASDIATIEKAGVVKIGDVEKGIQILNDGTLVIENASEELIKEKKSARRPIVPFNLDFAVKEGLANNALTWTEEEKARAREKLGAVSLQDNDTKVEKSNTANIIYGTDGNNNQVALSYSIGTNKYAIVQRTYNGDILVNERSNYADYSDSAAIPKYWIDKQLFGVCTRSDTYSKTEINELIGSRHHIIKVSELPNEDIDKSALYIVPIVSKNRFYTDIDDRTVNGVTVKVNRDKSITFNGTAEADINISLGSLEYLGEGAFTLSGCPSGGSQNGYCIVVSCSENVMYYMYDTGSGVCHYNNNAACGWSIFIAAGTVCDSLTFYPMIESGEEKTEYVPGIPRQNDFEEWIYLYHEDGDYYEWELIGTQYVDLSDYVKVSDIATIEKAGVVKVGEERDGKGVGIINGVLYTIPATEQQIKNKKSGRPVITPKNLDYAVKEGLANNALTWTEEEKARAREKLGIDEVLGVIENGSY